MMKVSDGRDKLLFGLVWFDVLFHFVKKKKKKIVFSVPQDKLCEYSCDNYSTNSSSGKSLVVWIRSRISHREYLQRN